MVSRHDLECLAVLRVELATVTAAIAFGDHPAVRLGLATMAQQIHNLQLVHDPSQQTCAGLTHANGALLPRYDAGAGDHG